LCSVVFASLVTKHSLFTCDENAAVFNFAASMPSIYVFVTYLVSVNDKSRQNHALRVQCALMLISFSGLRNYSLYHSNFEPEDLSF